MPSALNLTMVLKQDPESQAKLAHLKANFATAVQPGVEKAMRASQLLHFARVVVLEDKYIQVITEYDGDKHVYTDFFRVALGDVFKVIFDLVEDAPPWSELNNSDAFFKYTASKNIKSLGQSPVDPTEGFLFSATGETTVKEIMQKLGASK